MIISAKPKKITSAKAFYKDYSHLNGLKYSNAFLKKININVPNGELTEQQQDNIINRIRSKIAQTFLKDEITSVRDLVDYFEDTRSMYALFNDLKQADNKRINEKLASYGNSE